MRDRGDVHANFSAFFLKFSELDTTVITFDSSHIKFYYYSDCYRLFFYNLHEINSERNRNFNLFYEWSNDVRQFHTSDRISYKNLIEKFPVEHRELPTNIKQYINIVDKLPLAFILSFLNNKKKNVHTYAKQRIASLSASTLKPITENITERTSSAISMPPTHHDKLSFAMRKANIVFLLSWPESHQRLAPCLIYLRLQPDISLDLSVVFPGDFSTSPRNYFSCVRGFGGGLSGG